MFLLHPSSSHSNLPPSSQRPKDRNTSRPILSFLLLNLVSSFFYIHHFYIVIFCELPVIAVCKVSIGAESLCCCVRPHMLPCFPGGIICAGGESRRVPGPSKPGWVFAQTGFIAMVNPHRNATKLLSISTPTPLRRGPECLVNSYLYRAEISGWWEFVTADRRVVTLAV